MRRPRRDHRCPCATDPDGPCDQCEALAERRADPWADWTLDGLDDMADYAAAHHQPGDHL